MAARSSVRPVTFGGRGIGRPALLHGREHEAGIFRPRKCPVIQASLTLNVSRSVCSDMRGRP